jgi:type III secretory pathway component EscS
MTQIDTLIIQTVAKLIYIYIYIIVVVVYLMNALIKFTGNEQLR